ncbi:MAG: response regulator transcription factor [Clostridiales bacterium]|jgi:DNA-binding response OmpR family regulator|nr:response regulator transcription factor [Clostridiales bacterium]
MKKILVVEDDADINNLLVELLRNNEIAPTAAYSGSEALLDFANDHFDLILLDLMLPGKTGEQVLTEIRKVSAIPVIVLTARTDKETTVNLLRMGADDYINKPFDNNELLARVDIQLRREVPKKEECSQLKYRDIILDLDGYDAIINDLKAGLSKREFEILRLLMERPNRVLTKNILYEEVWGGEFLGDDNTVNVHISKLRAKLGAISQNTDYILTVWGIGFKMKE